VSFYSHHFPQVFFAICLAVGVSATGHAQVVPSAADAGRIGSKSAMPLPDAPSVKPEITNVDTSAQVAVPAGADAIALTLTSVRIVGATALPEAQLIDIYSPMIGKRVTLAQVYGWAAEITQRYRAAGYLLSYAYVPEQSIEAGKVTIAVAEVYLDHVKMEGDDPNHRITQHYIARLTAERPLTNHTLESTLLRLNDLPGRTYRAVLDRDVAAGPNAMMLTLVATKKAARASIGFDNFSSRYLGPNEINAYYANSLLPLQQTSILGLTSIPTDKLNFGSLQHSLVLMPDVSLEASASYTHSNPGYTLTPLQIDSQATNFGLSFNYQAIRQRKENLLLKVGGGARHIESDVFNTTPLTRDNVRSVETGFLYDRSDSWGGKNTINGVIIKGIEGLGSSKKGQSNLSRAQADPDFVKVEWSLRRSQTLATDWSLLMQASGQWANTPLFASEEFGVGGQSYGRAYDASEIVGDKGASAMAEIRYHGWRTLQPINVEPFAYYDNGFVTNKDSGQSKRASLSSAGGGLRFASTTGQSGTIGLAVPLTRDAAVPIYGASASSPRLMVQIAHNF
jgi:hemolysin activation/secretion protein